MPNISHVLSVEHNVSLNIIEDHGNIVLQAVTGNDSNAVLKGLFFDFDESVDQDNIVLFRTIWDPIQDFRLPATKTRCLTAPPCRKPSTWAWIWV